jgi:cysteine synthase A
MDWLARHGDQSPTAVTIAPDLGERYLDTIYQSNWVQDLYGDESFDSDELTTGARSA